MTPRRWGAVAAGLAAFAVFEAVKYGGVATAVLVVFVLLPDVPLLGGFAGEGRLRPGRVRAYHVLHHPGLPAALVLASLALPIPSLGWGLRGGLEVFLAGLAWSLHIATDRALGFGPREPDGTIRGTRPPASAGRSGTRVEAPAGEAP